MTDVEPTPEEITEEMIAEFCGEDLDPMNSPDGNTPENIAASKMLYSLRRVTRKKEEAKALVKAHKAELDAWLADREATAEKSITYLTQQLELHYQAAPSSVKVVKDPYGSYGMYKGRKSLRVTDEGKLGEWLSGDGKDAAVPAPAPRPDKKLVAKIIESGVAVPGAEVHDPGMQFQVKPHMDGGTR